MAAIQMIILHSLVILSLIIPNLATYTPQPASIQQPLSQRSEPLLDSTLLASSTPLVFSDPLVSSDPLTPSLQQSETSAQESAPTGETPSAESSPDSDNPADEAELAAYLLAQIPPDSPLLAASQLLDTTQPAETQLLLRLAALQAPQPGATLTLAYQISAPLSAENYRLQVQAPAAATWQGKDPSLFDAASQTLDLPLEFSTGLLSFYIDPQALGPFEFKASLSLAQASLLQSEQSLSLSLSESGLTQIPAGGGWASAFDGQVQVHIPPTAAPQALTLRIRNPLGEARPPHSPSGQPFEILAHSAADQQALTQFAEPLTIQVSEFSAAASASYNFWTPPGHGGLQPSLSLHYNSQAVDNAIAGHTQAGWSAWAGRSTPVLSNAICAAR